MKTKTSVWLIGVLLLVAVALWFARRDRVSPPAPHSVEAAGSAAAGSAGPASLAAAPGATRAPVVAASEAGDPEAGVVLGRVLHGLTREGVPSAELTFLGDGGVSTVRTRGDGGFELRSASSATFVLSTITAPGFLPFAPELGHSNVRVAVIRGKTIRGVTLLLYPALDYQGLVVDARGAPVADARVRLLGSSSGEQVLESVAAEWKTDRDGHFAFHAAADSVLEASHGEARGWARIDRGVALRKKLTIQIGRAAARDATIAGHVRDAAGAAIGDALVHAMPSDYDGDVATVFATSGPDGAFTLAGVDRRAYDVVAEAEGHARGEREKVAGGSRNVEIVLDAGLPLAGQVVDARGEPVPVFTLLVRARLGVARPTVAARSLIDPQGRFAVRVAPGDYDVLASAHGHARATATQASAGATDVRIVLGAGATLRGQVIAGDDRAPVRNATVACEMGGGGASAMPADPGTVTGADGTFELPGISPGPVSIRINADGFHEKIEAGITASDGAMLGPISIELTRAAPDDADHVELVGIGVGLRPDGDALRVTQVLPGSGAVDAGITTGDRVVAIDGLPVAPLGLEGAITKIRGVVGTTVTLTLRRDGQDVLMVIQRRKLRT